MQNPNRAEAERLLGVSEKLLYSRDLDGSRDFAVLSQETDPLLEGSDQILAIVDVLLATEKRVSPQSSHHDWYAILQIPRRSDDLDLIKRQYHRLALLLHPDKNKYQLADQAFRFVAAAWSILSDPSKKSLYDKEFNSPFSKVDLTASAVSATAPSSSSSKLPVRRHVAEVNARPPPQQQQTEGLVNSSNNGNGSIDSGSDARLTTFWTACPYCYVLYEYPGVYEDCCLRCQGCQRAFQAVVIQSPPAAIPGKEAYHCCWGMFPLGFQIGVDKTRKVVPAPAPATEEVLPDWMGVQSSGGGSGHGGVSRGMPMPAVGTTGKKKRGRPRKNPVPA